MDLEKVFHMTGGAGETSYSRNSSLQKKASDEVKLLTLETIEEVHRTLLPKSLGIADLGCSSGPNTFSTIRDIVETIEEACRTTAEVPEFRIYLNDLPTNDFNTIFKALPDFYKELKKGRIDGGPSIYIAGFPGSFYGRLFPDNCLHFIYSSFSLHWLSKMVYTIHQGGLAGFKIMDLEKVFHMTGGAGETSYSRNSSLQKKASDEVKLLTLETIEEVHRTLLPKSLGIADLGCSSGPNTFSTIRDIVETIEEACRTTAEVPEFRIYLNDLPTNDFNTIFKALPDFYKELKKGRIDGGPSIYIAGFPGSFYGRLFPDNCLHFIYSSFSLHWLSKMVYTIHQVGLAGFKIMDLEKVFHMTGGAGETSYSRNSSLQKKASDEVKLLTLETIEEVHRTLLPKSLGIADLGCSSGPNTFSTIRDIVETIEEACRTTAEVPEFRIYLNDLPTNDFNTIFKALPDFYKELKKGRIDGGPSIYIAGFPGSFYGRLFPDNCLHFIYSSFSLHWLSKMVYTIHQGGLAGFKIMDLEKVFHMTSGAGETSYSRNSSLQKKASDEVELLTLETIEEVHRTLLPKSLGIADLGCPSGPNTFSTIRDIVETIEEACRTTAEVPEFRIYLNDLPTNDFNTIFKALPDFYKELKKGRIDGGSSIYIAGFHGSFYERLFPDNCLHFIYSSFSLHWLSKMVYTIHQGGLAGFKIMDLEKVFHMTGGAGETSYSRNSSLQKKASDEVELLTLETIEEVHRTLLPKSLGIADLGCPSGPNTFSTIRDIVETIEEACRTTAEVPEFRIYLNDLPTNDFNTIFKALPDFYKELKKGRIDGGPSIYIAGFHGSFYGRLFPDNCLHFIYSSFSLHWLSKMVYTIHQGGLAGFKIMDLEKVFHMTGGAGETSYSRNSSLQKKASDEVELLTLETIEEVHRTLLPKSLGIADLGCPSGPNTFSTIRDIVETIEEACRTTAEVPEFRIYLNDLPTNDFNTIFKALPDFYKELKKGRIDGGPSIYIAGFPGSFYGRLFPDNCLHFIYSSFSLHWLSKVPSGLYEEGGLSINKGSIYISEKSPAQVSEAYYDQFRQDFLFFLSSRSEELVRGGKMILILLGREGPGHIDRGNSLFWKLMTRAFQKLVEQGHVAKEKIDSYDVHFYAPSKEEVEVIIKTEGSFKVDHLQLFEVEKEVKSDYDGSTYGTKVSKTVRAIQESMIIHHFGEEILENLFEEYGRLLDEEVAREDITPLTLVAVLTKI